MSWWEDRCKPTDIWASHAEEYNRYGNPPKQLFSSILAIKRYFLLNLSSRYEWAPRWSWMTRKKEDET